MMRSLKSLWMRKQCENKDNNWYIMDSLVLLIVPFVQITTTSNVTLTLPCVFESLTISTCACFASNTFMQQYISKQIETLTFTNMRHIDIHDAITRGEAWHWHGTFQETQRVTRYPLTRNNSWDQNSIIHIESFATLVLLRLDFYSTYIACKYCQYLCPQIKDKINTLVFIWKSIHFW